MSRGIVVEEIHAKKQPQQGIPVVIITRHCTQEKKTSNETKERQANKRNQQRRFPYHRVPISRNWYEEFAKEIHAKNPYKEPTALYVLVVTRNHCRTDSCKESTRTRHSYNTFAKQISSNCLCVSRRPTYDLSNRYTLLTPDLGFEDPLADCKSKLRRALRPYGKNTKSLKKH